MLLGERQKKGRRERTWRCTDDPVPVIYITTSQLVHRDNYILLHPDSPLLLLSLSGVTPHLHRMLIDRRNLWPVGKLFYYGRVVRNRKSAAAQTRMRTNSFPQRSP